VIYDTTGGFFWLFVLLAVSAALVALVGAFLPSDRPAKPAAAAAGVRVQPAE